MKYAESVLIAVCIALTARCAKADPLIVVEDHGGDSAQPYYAPLKLQPNASAGSNTPSQPPAHISEADMLPVHSARLSPGIESSRSINAPGLTPLFLVGDDERSRVWLHKNRSTLIKIKALGFLVNVETAQALTALRALAPGLNLAPVSGDDLAQRLNLHHYPVLITATAIEQ